MTTLQMPRPGDLLQSGDGTLWRIRGVAFLDGDEEAFPGSRTLYLDVSPEMARAEIPEGIRRSLEE